MPDTETTQQREPAQPPERPVSAGTGARMRGRAAWLIAALSAALLLPLLAAQAQEQGRTNAYYPYAYYPWPQRPQAPQASQPSRAQPAPPAPPAAPPKAASPKTAAARPAQPADRTAPEGPLPPDFQWAQSRRGWILADAAGRSLYTYSEDGPGQSRCTGPCMRFWPPLAVAADAAAPPPAPFGIMTRPDGARQWTWQGRPLYRWHADRNAGDITGDRVKGQWHVVQP